MIHRDHESMREMLHELVEGELDSGNKEDLEAHLEACPECRETLETLTSTLEMLRALPHPEAPPDLAARVRRRLRRRSAPGRRRHPVQHRIEATSAAAVLVATVLVAGARLMAPMPESLENGLAAEDRALTESWAKLSEPGVELPAADQQVLHRVLTLAATAGAVDEMNQPLVAPSPADEIPPGEHLLWLTPDGLESVLQGAFSSRSFDMREREAKASSTPPRQGEEPGPASRARLDPPRDELVPLRLVIR